MNIPQMMNSGPGMAERACPETEPFTRDEGLVLATDLDGTLIPLADSSENASALSALKSELSRHAVPLVYVTGRHLASVLQAIATHALPAPDWILSDVGTSIYRRSADGEFRLVDAYQKHLDERIANLPIASLRERLKCIVELRPQEEVKQGRFKLSYYVDADCLERVTSRLEALLKQWQAPYSTIHSIDPWVGHGLLDILPASVSKDYALAWWCKHAGTPAESIVFAGDSGNDLAAFTAGYRAIVVGNTSRQIARQVYDVHRARGWRDRLFLAQGTATSGVLEGCRWFGVLAPKRAAISRLGATSISINETHFRVWAPDRSHVAVEIEAPKGTFRCALTKSARGYFSGHVAGARPFLKYQYVLDEKVRRPDPTSSFLPDGVHGSSQVIPHRAFAWTDQSWPGVPKRQLVIYEIHVGAFTDEGTFRAAIERLPELVALGITAVEVMPVAQTPGKWNWGYDGVGLFAVRNTYGDPDDFKAFVDACHQNDIAVILDVVYNHLGPEGNYLADFGPYFSSRHHTPWGEAFNFDGPQATEVRHYVLENVTRWLEEFHLDGLRLDAVHFMHDDSQPTILQEIRQVVTTCSRTAGRELHLIAEANVFDAELLESAAGEECYDAIWCDCLMHSIYSHGVPGLKLTRREYRGASDIATALRCGYVFEGKAYTRSSSDPGQDRRRHLESLVMALQTHDSVGNHPHGQRLHHLTSKQFQKAAAALVLLFPSIPLIFMGEETASAAPFPFFADFEDPRLREAIDAGRAAEYPQHAWHGAVLPSDPAAFRAAKSHRPAEQDQDVFAWYCDLLALRKQGLRAGWLSAQNLITAHDPERHLFSLAYQLANRGRPTVIVQVYLPPVAQELPPLEVPRSGTLRCSSREISFRDDKLQLLANHAVVWCNDETS